MTVFLCFLRTDANSSRTTDTKFLGVSSNQSDALFLCATAVIARAVGKIKLFCSYSFSNKEHKLKELEGAKESYKSIQERVYDLTNELFSKNNIQTVDELNVHLQVYMRKIGVARRWCDIVEAEADQPVFLD